MTDAANCSAGLPWCAKHDTYPHGVIVHWSPRWSPTQVNSNRLLQVTRYDAPDEPGDVRVHLSAERDEALTPAQARSLAAWLLEVADVVEGMR